MTTPLDRLFDELRQENSETTRGVQSSTGWLSSLPLILCGPILRKVHYESVSVWLAFKDDVSDVRLDVFSAASPSTPLLSGTVPRPLMLGRNLFVTVVTAVSKGSKLSADQIYGYDISFKHGGVSKQLKTAGVLKNGIGSITYTPFTFPTFCLPADKVDELKIVHGSCRKPHGGRTDALRGLDTIIELNSTKPRERPQLLCLTGDQIYADDVSDILLYQIIQAEKNLLGWKEKLPKDYSTLQLSPGFRKDIIAKTGNKNIRWGFGSRKITPDDLTTTDADSHLIYFSEFLLMYLFAFSEVLWRPWPTWGELYSEYKPPKNQTEAIAYVAGWQRRKNLLKIHPTRLASFLKSLPYVRKAVANTPVLMIFDDHDCTDDWFITREWSAVALLKGTTSRRYILNSLLAYVVFQDWGNNPQKYSSGIRAKILDHLNLRNKNSYLTNVHLRANPHASDLESFVLPVLIDDRKNPKDPSSYLVNKVRWDYQINYNSFTLFVLNTRTERQYFEKEKPMANLIKSIQPEGQFSSEKLAVVISAVPIFANVPLEIGQESLQKGTTDVVTGIVSRNQDIIGMFEKDQESWSFSGRGFGKLLAFLSIFKRVLVLSGDVHHSFTAQVKLWRKIGTDNYHVTKIVQSTSSALKNSTEGTHYPAINKYGFEPKANTTYKRIKVLGVKKQGEKFKEFDNPRFQDPQEYNPDRTRIHYETVLVDPALQYSVNFVRSAGYGIPTPLASNIKRSSQASKFRDAGGVSPVPGTAVGKDNVAVISFAPDSIVASIWLANGTRDKPDDLEADRLLFPYVKHPTNLSPVFSISELPVKEFDKIRARMSMR
ncbi:MAG TPA: hypothetical protein VL866_23240 [Pyrinomonadaceae bacterium]|nr:hypothetical protein [Pyrinomonadaceae bacterium]